MNLQAQAKRALAGMPLFQTGSQRLEATFGQQHLECDLLALDTLACAFARLAVRRDTPSNLSVKELRETAEKLSARLTYLLEPISPIEIDSQGCTVQMRSNPPQKDADVTSYYELLVDRGGQLSLTRYSRPAGAPREVIPAQVTREVLLRLVGSFAAVAR